MDSKELIKSANTTAYFFPSWFVIAKYVYISIVLWRWLLCERAKNDRIEIAPKSVFA